jgi:hypothetical protein
MEILKRAIDRRGREWEMFCDVGYWNYFCVRDIEDRDFNSPTCFHFDTQAEAYQFITLLEVSN